MENSNAVIPKLSAWSGSLARGGPSQKVTTVVISLGNFWRFGQEVACERCSHMEVRQYLRDFFFSIRDGFVEEGCANLQKEFPWNYPLAIKTATEKF